MSEVERLHPILRERIADRLGWPDLRPAQKLAIPPILDGHDTLVLAPTAGGKTEAAFFPVLSALYAGQARPVSVLYLSPLKALINNQEPRLRRLAAMVDRTVFKWHGDVADGQKATFRREPADILMITPESLEGLFLAGRGSLFRNLRFVVIDEAHAFAGTDRGAHLMSLLNRCSQASEHALQMVALSATLGNPADLLNWIAGTGKRPRTVVDPPRSGVKRYFSLRFVPGAEPHEMADVAYDYLAGKRTMFFVDARKQAEALRPALEQAGIPAAVHHASIDKRLREEAEANVQDGAGCLVCTSTMELGVDVGELDAVVQLDAPASVASYLQRMGRSGRRGAPGTMVVLADDREGFLRAIALTELARRRWCEPVGLPSRAWTVYVHQLLALLLAEGATPVEDLYERLHACAAFSGIRPEEHAELVEHLCSLGLLERVRHKVRLGYGAEQEFGDRNYSDLCSVFEGGAPQLTVMHKGHAIGSIDRSYARKLGMGGQFNLAGQAWKAARLDERTGRLEVSALATGSPDLPRWRGAGKPVMATEVAREIRGWLERADHPSYLDPPEQVALDRLRAEARESGLQPGAIPCEPLRRTWRLWTLAGERTNRVIALALADALGCHATLTWERITLHALTGEPRIAFQDIHDLLLDWGRHGLDAVARQAVLDRLPEAGNLRFARFLPPTMLREVRQEGQIDFAAAGEFLAAHTAVELESAARRYLDEVQEPV